MNIKERKSYTKRKIKSIINKWSIQNEKRR